MHVYRDLTRTVDPHEVLQRLARSSEFQLARAIPDRETAMEALIEFGEMETALTDLISVHVDGFPPEVENLRRIALALGTLFHCAWRNVRPNDTLRSLTWELDRLRSRLKPRPLQVRMLEGFALYGLHPSSYLLAAEALAREYPAASFECIGLRSIGAPLSAVVSATLSAGGSTVHAWTVRPRGSPFSRRLAIDEFLATRWRAASERQAHFLVIDEGPGLSGSSFCGTADHLLSLGIAETHIHFFPSWDPDPAKLKSENARYRWPRHRRFLAPFDPHWALSAHWEVEALEEISAGRWRRRLYSHPSAYPAVQPQHERRKYFSAATGTIVKFAGFGPYGQEKPARAAELSYGQWAPPLISHGSGFITHAFVPGVPLRRRDLSRDLLDHAARYFAFLQHRFAHGGVDPEPVLSMASANIREAVGHASARWEAAVSVNRTRLGQCSGIALDGRVQPHEWIHAKKGFIKVDALDHHDDHFYPGIADIAWDLAGFACEFDLNENGCSVLLDRFHRHGGDGEAGGRFPFYRAAYAAFRLGYARLATDALGNTDDASRFARLSDYYAAHLRSALDRIGR